MKEENIGVAPNEHIGVNSTLRREKHVKITILIKKRPLKDNIYTYISQKTATFAAVLRKVKHVRLIKTHHIYIKR